MQFTHQLCKNILRFLNQIPKSLERGWGWGRQAPTLGVIYPAGNIPDGDALTHGCGRHGEPLLQKLLTLHSPQNHQLNLACLERVKDAVADIFPFCTPKAAHAGSHHPLVTAESSHCELGDCPAHETTSVRWEAAVWP